MSKTPTDATPVGLLAFLPRLVKLAKEHGYALAVHGSMARDYDLIAVAWTCNAKPAQELVDAFVKTTGGIVVHNLDADPYDFTMHGPEPKPHGRLAWSIHLGGGPYIDLSVIPPEPDPVERLMARVDQAVADFSRQQSARLPMRTEGEPNAGEHPIGVGVAEGQSEREQ